MNGAKKYALLGLGGLSAILVVSQFVMGMLILRGGSEGIRKAHQHSGYLTAVVALVYIAWSLMVVASLAARPKS